MGKKPFKTLVYHQLLLAAWTPLASYWFSRQELYMSKCCERLKYQKLSE